MTTAALARFHSARSRRSPASIGDAAITVAGYLERWWANADNPSRWTARRSPLQRTFVDRWAGRKLLEGQRNGLWQAVVHGHLHRPGLRPSGAIDAGHSTDGRARWIEIHPDAGIVRREV